MTPLGWIRRRLRAEGLWLDHRQARVLLRLSARATGLVTQEEADLFARLAARCEELKAP